MLDPQKKSDFQQALINWYQANGRDLPWRRTSDAYCIWVSEVMLQQTRVDTAISYYFRFLENFPAIENLAAAPLQQVLKSWEGLGYYARARNLHRAAAIVATEYNGQVPDTVEAFTALPGVGPYIGAAVLSIAFGRPLAVADGNVKRVLSRVFAEPAPVNVPAAHKTYPALAADLLDSRRPGAFNQALMELGALVCRPKTALCRNCPVSAHCLAYGCNETDLFPVRRKTRPVPLHRLVAVVIQKGRKVLIVCRPENGLLGGLWEFPGDRISEGESAIDACHRIVGQTLNLRVQNAYEWTQVRHAYTHFRVEARVVICDYAAGRIRPDGPADFQWAGVRAFGRHPFTGMTRRFLPALMEKLQAVESITGAPN